MHGNNPEICGEGGGCREAEGDVSGNTSCRLRSVVGAGLLQDVSLGETTLMDSALTYK